jgi:ribosomal protein S21
MDSPRFRSPNVRSNFLQVFVRDNNVEQALRVLKKKMQREGVFREMRRRRFYEKPSEEAARRKFRRGTPHAQARAETGDPGRIDRCSAEEEKGGNQAAHRFSRRGMTESI